LIENVNDAYNLYIELITTSFEKHFRLTKLSRTEIDYCRFEEDWQRKYKLQKKMDDFELFSG